MKSLGKYKKNLKAMRKVSFNANIFDSVSLWRALLIAL